MHVRQMNEQFVLEVDQHVIIDTHGGLEDILGIVSMLALAKESGKEVLGITCVNGRYCLEDVVKHVLYAQNLAKTAYPVFIGAAKSILLQSQYPATHNFQNLGIQINQKNLNFGLLQKKTAPVFISQSLQRYASSLVFVSFGPLTNIALGYHLWQGSTPVSSLRICGGNSTGAGNVKIQPSAQGNFYYDPEAAAIVLSNFSNNYITTSELTLQTNFRVIFQAVIAKYPNKRVNQLLKNLLSKEYCLCGPLLTVLPIFDRSIALKVQRVYSEVIPSGLASQGLMAPNWLRLEVLPGEQVPNTKIYSGFNMARLQKELLRVLSHLE